MEKELERIKIANVINFITFSKCEVFIAHDFQISSYLKLQKNGHES